VVAPERPVRQLIFLLQIGSLATFLYKLRRKLKPFYFSMALIERS
jgi:hypothetical protein